MENIENKYHIFFDVEPIKSKAYYPKKSEKTSITDIYQYISQKLNCPANFFWLMYAGKPLILSKTLQDYQIESGSQIIVNIRNRGGLFGGGGLTDIVNSIFEPLIEPAVMIGNVFVNIYKILLVCVKLLVWISMFAYWVMTDLFRPWEIFTEFFTTLARIARLSVLSIIGFIMGIVKYTFNFTFGTAITSIWGWDYDMNKNKGGNSKNREKSRENMSNLSEKDDKKCNGDKCYQTPKNKLPFSVIMATILLPPLGLLMEFGISSWINIILCCFLTLWYYFPGLIYALILLYC